MIRSVIFDLDNTLYNFDLANEKGLEALAAYTHPALGWDLPTVKQLYVDWREKLTARMGDVGSSHNRLIRFQNLLEDKGLPLYPHALEMARIYWRGVLDAMEITPGASDILQTLRDMGLRVGLGTDMTAYIQYEKMHRLGLLPYMDFIVSSEEAGTDKPGRAFFRLCADKAGCSPDECLFIGDNVIRDFGGAVSLGMQARWFIPPWKEKRTRNNAGTNVTASGLLSLADGSFPEQAIKDLSPDLAAAFRHPSAEASRTLLDAVPLIHSLSEIPEIVKSSH